MKKINCKPFAVLIWLLLLVCWGTNVHAQPAREEERQPGEERRRPRQSTLELFDRNSAREATTQPLNSVRIEIRQNKKSGSQSESGSTSCEAFDIDFTPTRSGEVLIPLVREPTMRESGGYYVCDFLIPGLPLNQEITISASVDEPNSPTPSGWQSQIQDGTRIVRLTESEPRASLSFEMAYVPLPDLVRPRPSRNRLFEAR
jgi:hypothetical protein